MGAKLTKADIIKMVQHQEIKPQAAIKLINSLSQLEDHEEEDAIAIIGMSGQFPGADNITEFWNNLILGRDSITEIPENRWSIDGFYDPDLKAPNKSNSKWGGFVKNFDQFDPLFFHISPKEAEYMEPQQRLFLMEAYKALEDAGYTKTSINGQKCGVFVGYGGGDYTTVIRDSKCDVDAYQFMGNSGSILASRIAYYLNLKGPAISLDTACSSSLVAAHLAMESLHDHSSDIAIVGGSMMFSTKDYYLMASKTNMLAAKGRCRTFDKDADGFTPGEAVAAIILKPYKKALADNDHIYGLIIGSGVNQDGQTNGITAPSSSSQQGLINRVYDAYNINPETIGYVEAHGTGTALGDPIEIFALTDAYRKYTQKTGYLPIGSVKTNIGHTLVASGVCSMIKTLLCIKNHTLVPSLHYQEKNPKIDFEHSPFWVNTKATPWNNQNHQPLRAAISAFGFSGTNCHMVMQEHQDATVYEHPEDVNYLFPISAHTTESLQKVCEKYFDYVSNNIVDYGNLSYSLAMTRTHHRNRIVILAKDIKEFKQNLSDYMLGKDNSHVFTTKTLHDTTENLANQLIYDTLNAYLSGKEIDWTPLYEEGRFQKLFLPDYVFTTNRYWIEENVLHPIVVENRSNRNETKFLMRCKNQNFYLRDHRVGGNCVIPGVVYLEAAYFTGTKAKKEPILALKNMTWLKTVTVTDETEILVNFTPTEDGISAHFFDANDEKTRLAKCDIIYGESINRPEKISIEDLIKGLRYIPSNECYEAFHNVGFAYGKSFRVIQELYYNDSYVVSHLKLSEDMESNQEAFTLNPALMDGALQTVMVFMAHVNSGIKGSYVPFCLKELYAYEKLPKECYVYAKVEAEEGFDGSKKFDLVICDLSGNVLVSMKDFLARPLSKQEPVKESKELYLTKVWEEKPLPKEIHFTDQMVTFVPENFDTYRLSTISEISNNPYRYTDFDQFAATNTVENNAQLLVMVNESSFTKDHCIAQDFFQLLQKIMKTYASFAMQPISVILAFEKNEELFACRGLSGLIQTFHQEQRTITWKLLELDTFFNLTPSMILQEFAVMNEKNAEEDSIIKYENHSRFVEILQQTEIKPANVPVIVSGSTYLLTGGFGKIGFQTALYLAKHKANLAIIGRKPFESVQHKIAELESYGVTVTYASFDVSNLLFVQQFVDRVNTASSPLRGVIHAAGILHDQRFIEKNYQDFVDVSLVKLTGITNLDVATKNLSLDFFVADSALACVFGNVGQSDYCFANASLEAFMNQRNELINQGIRSGKSLAIAWPFWRDGGMKLPDLMLQQLHQKLGLVPLSNEEGIRIFDEILASCTTNVAILYKDENVVLTPNQQQEESHVPVTANTATNFASETMSTRISHVSETNTTIKPEEVDDMEISTVEQFIKEEICRILKVPMSYINNENDLGAFGFDSLTYTELSESLNQAYHLDLTPATFFEYHTLGSIMNYLKEHHKEILKKQGKEIPVVSHNQTMSQDDITNQGYQPVAIIGMAGMMPGCDTLDEFFEALLGGENLVTEIPANRFDWHKYYGDPRMEDNKTNSKWGSFMKDVDCFDAEFFGISPKEAQVMDPQQRLFLQIVWHTIEDAGYSADAFWGKKIGLFVGTSTSDYQELLRENKMDIQSFSALGVTHSVIANRISYFMNWSGESEPVDTACSSSLVALHKAVSVIQNGECEMAVAGGINCILSPSIYISFGKAGMLSPDGTCKTFDESANGYVRGEGGGALLLKPLSKALRDHDHIYAVVKGSAVNHCGKTNSLTSPNPNAQSEVIKEALIRSQVAPESISYIEAHGTGTNIGDPIEINGLKNAFLSMTHQTSFDVPFCGLGSVKSNVGHLEAAAGMASIIKVLLSMEHNVIPPTIHYHKLNPYIHLEQSPFYIVDTKRDWDQTLNQRYPKRAGISGFGFSGVNAHVVLEECKQTMSAKEDKKPYIFVLSALHMEQLKVYANKMISYFKKYGSDLSTKDVAYTLQTGRKDFTARLAIVFDSMEILIQRLQNYIDGKSNTNIFCKTTNDKEELFDGLFLDELGQEYINQLLERNKVATVAKLWVSGCKLEWNRLYTGEMPYRISLPGYPFEKKHYWMKKKEEKTKANPVLTNLQQSFITEGNPSERGHFQIVSNKRNESDYEFTAYVKSSDWIVCEHQVQGKKVLPGTGVLELVAEAFEQMKPSSNVWLKEIYWLRPVVVDTDISLTLRFHKENNMFSFELMEKSSESSNLYAKGIISSNNRTNVLQIDVTTLESRMMHTLSREEHYQTTKALGITFGARFQTIERIKLNGSEALITFTREMNQNQQNSRLPFLSMDGAMQGISGVSLDHRSGPLLPYYIESIDMQSFDNNIAYAYIQKNENSKYDIQLLNEFGEVICQLQTVVVRTSTMESEQNTYTYRWTQLKDEDVFYEKDSNETCAILYHKRDRQIVRSLAENYLPHQVLFVQEEYEINHMLNQLFDSNQHLNVDKIYYLLGINEPEEFSQNMNQYSLDNSSVMKLFRFIKAFDERNAFQQKVCFTIVTSNLYQVADEAISPACGGIYGFMNSAIKEYENLYVSYVDIDLNELKSMDPTNSLQSDEAIGITWNHENVEAVTKSIARLNCGKSIKELALRSGKLYRKSFAPILPKMEEGGFKKDGVYVIIGGRGGIGTQLTKYLLKKYQAKVALIGRKPELSDEEKTQFEAFKRNGGNLLYVRADVGNYEELRNAVDLIEHQFGQINGVIHSAIVLEDKRIHNMSEEDMKKVIWPKGIGSIQLYKVFMGKSLDFILYFSSVQSIIGMMGQSNYSAACTMKEAVADYINSKEDWKIRVINWGYWGNTGIVSSKDYQSRMKKIGIYSIENDEGMNYIEEALSNPMKQMLVIKCSDFVKESIGINESTPLQVNATTKTVEHLPLHQYIKVKDIMEDTSGYLKISGYAAKRLLSVFQSAGLFTRAKTPYEITEVKHKLGIISKYDRLFEELLNILERNHFIHRNGSWVETKDSIDLSMKQLTLESSNLVLTHPETESYMNLINACMERYLEILQGSVTSTEVMFPNSNVNLVGNVYKGNKISDFYNMKLADWVRNFVETRLQKSPNTPIRILEIGAGTGGTSTYVLRELKEFGAFLRYDYTDVAESFANYGRMTYGKTYPFVDFKVFDMEQPVNEVAGIYDLVIGTNVLHVSGDINCNLNHLKQVMKQNGALVFCEMVSKEDYITLTFGLLDGWWQFHDGEARIEGTPLFTQENWKKVLYKNGFTNFDSLNQGESTMLPQDVMVAYSDGICMKNELIAPKKPMVDSGSFTPAKEKQTTVPVVTASIPKQSIHDYVEEVIRQSLFVDLEIEEEKINRNKSFKDYGIDSITGVNVIQTLNKSFGIDMKTIVLFDYSTIAELTDYIVSEYGNQIKIENKQVENIPMKNQATTAMKESNTSTDDDEMLKMLRELEEGNLSVERVSQMLGDNYGEY